MTTNMSQDLNIRTFEKTKQVKRGSVKKYDFYIVWNGNHEQSSGSIYYASK